MTKGPTVITLNKNELVDTLEALLEMAKKGEIEGMVAAGLLKSGEVFTATSKVDIVQQHMLSSYIHTNAMMKIVQQNSI